MSDPIRIAAVGLDHRHIYGMCGHLIDAGAALAAFWTDGEPNTLPGFVKRFPAVRREPDLDALLGRDDLDLVCISAIPGDRAALAMRAMEAGHDVMVDKPGCVTLEELASIRACVARTGCIWSVNFSERFEVPCVTRASELVAGGEIGRVVQTLGIGPHRLNRATRPDWFFERSRYGGILTDIASHQIDQFLHFTGSTEAEVAFATVGNFANPADPGLQDFGQIVLQSDAAQGYVRVDWYTPDALPTWGDGRLTILGTEGYIELRKYVDPAGRTGTDHLFLVNGTRCEYIDATAAGMPYFSSLIFDIRNRSETAMAQSHVFTVMELALRAQEMAERRDRASEPPRG